MSLPQQIPVLGQSYRIIRKKMSDCYGETDFDEKTITIKKGIRQDNAEKTLLHEVIHAALFQSGHSIQWEEDAEEPIVRALEHALWQAGYRREHRPS